MELKDPSFEDESFLRAVSTLSLSSNTSTQAQTSNGNGQKSILLALPTEIRQVIFMHVAFPPQRNTRYNPKRLPKTALDPLRPSIEANGEDWLNLNRWHYLVHLGTILQARRAPRQPSILRVCRPIYSDVQQVLHVYDNLYQRCGSCLRMLANRCTEQQERQILRLLSEAKYPLRSEV